jgi:hypothetical protein
LQLWFKIFIAVGLLFTSACAEADGLVLDGGTGGTLSWDPLGTSGIIAATTGGTNASGVGASGSGLPNAGGTGEGAGSGPNAGSQGGGGTIHTGGSGGTGVQTTGGTDVQVTGGTGVQVTGGTDVQVTGGTDVQVTGGVGPTGGSGGFDNGGNNFIRGPDPTVESATANGPYATQMYSFGFAIGPDFPGGDIYYPTDAEPPFAGIAIVPGFTEPRILVSAWGPFIASHGIVAFIIDTNTVMDQPSQRSRALLNALESLAAENTRADSPLNGKLDNSRQAVGGHSMGGGGTLITVNGNPQLKAGIPMCAWNPGGNNSRTQVPTLLFASSGDPLAGGQSQGFYRSIPESTPKMLFEWGLGDHFLANAPTGAAGQVGRYGISWLKVFLEGDERYRQFLQQPCDGCTDFQSNL